MRTLRQKINVFDERYKKSGRAIPHEANEIIQDLLRRLEALRVHVENPYENGNVLATHLDILTDLDVDVSDQFYFKADSYIGE